MYLAYPAPDDETLALSLESFKARFRESMEREPERFMMHRRRRLRRLPPARRGSNDPLRLVRRQPGCAAAAKAAAAISRQDGRTGPENLLREALAAARQRGYSLENLAEQAGMSERTLRRRLKTPEAIPLGEYCVILRAAGGRTTESEG